MVSSTQICEWCLLNFTCNGISEVAIRTYERIMHTHYTLSNSHCVLNIFNAQYFSLFCAKWLNKFWQASQYSSKLPLLCFKRWAMAVLGSLASSNGDTFASEIGSVCGNSKPFLITNLQCVPRGKDEQHQALQIPITHMHKKLKRM